MEIIDYWREFDFNSDPLIHKKDKYLISNPKCKKYLNESKTHLDFVSNNDYFSDSTQVHINLIPVPYIGDITNSKIFLLMTNPGIDNIDYFAENSSEHLKQRLIENLRQELNHEFKFLYLQPELLWHGASIYWQNKFSPLINYLIKEHGNSYREASKIISDRIAIIQYFPYHSKSFQLPNHILSNIESNKKIVNFVQNYLLPKAKKEEVCLICARRIGDWKLPNNDKNILILPSSKARNPSFKENSEIFNLAKKYLI